MASKENTRIHPETVRMAEYIRAITAAGSVHAVGIEFISPIQCMKRHNSRRCKGKMRITPRADVIEYCCTDCETCGIIANWRGSEWNLSEFASGLTAPGLLTVSVSEDEYKALRKVLLLSPKEEAIIAGAVWTDSHVVITGTEDVFDELAGNVAFEANHSPGTKKQAALDSVCEKIEKVLET